MGEFAITGPDGRSYRVTGETAEGALAALRKATGGAQEAPEKPGFWQRMGEGAVGVVNDIGAAFQGVNPVAMSDQTGQAVGVLRSDPTMGEWVDVDGTREPLENYPPDRYATRVEPSNGLTYIYPRETSVGSIEESRLASAGRAAGYGVISQLPKALAETPKPEGFREAAQALDITPSFAMQNKPAAMVAAGGEQLVTTAGRFGQDAARVTDEIATAAGKIADKAGPGATRVEAGEALRRGANIFVENVRKKQGQFYDAVDRAIPRKTRVGTPETVASLRRELDALAETPNISASLGNKELQGWLKDLEGAAPAAAAAAGKAKRPVTVMEALQSVGVKDLGGDLRAMGVPDWDKARVGRKNVLRSDGLQPDLAARWLWENGYLNDMPEAAAMRAADAGMGPEPDLVAAMMRAIDDELMGEPRFAAQDFDAAAAWKRSFEDGAEAARSPAPGVAPGTSGNEPGLTWEAARKLRTDIGEAIGKINGPLANQTQGRLKDMYGALTRDMEAAANAAGPEAAFVWKRANDFTRESSKRIEQALGQILKADSPERAFEGFMARAKQGTARSNITDMSRAFRSLPKDEQAVVSGSIIRMLGEAAPGAQNAAGDAFSASSFLTNWNKLAPEAREIIAKNGLEPGVMKDLDRLALVIDRAKAAGGARNFSNTAGAANASAMMAGAMVAPASTATFAGLSHLSARLVTNPTLLRAVNQFYAGNPARLRSIASGQTPLAVEAATILRLEGQLHRNHQEQQARKRPVGPADDALHSVHPTNMAHLPPE